MKAVQQALQHAHAKKAGANQALHVVLAEQKQQVNAAAQRAACAALHVAFSAWHVAAKPAPLTDGSTECAVTDRSSEVTSTSSATAGTASAATGAEPAGTDSAGNTGAVDKTSVAISDASPAASAESEGGAVPTTRCCMHVLTSF